MSTQQFFGDPGIDALMGSMLATANQQLLLEVRYRRLSQAVRAVDGRTPPDPEGRLTEDERAWVRERADRVVAGWLEPFARAGRSRTSRPPARGGA